MRIATWNIEQFSNNRAQVGAAPARAVDAIARVIFGANVDIAVTVELSSEPGGHNALHLMATALRALENPAAPPPGRYLPIVSPKAGSDRYGFIVRDPTVTVPLTVPRAALPAFGGARLGWKGNPLRDLNDLRFVPNPAPDLTLDANGIPADVCAFLVDAWTASSSPYGPKKQESFIGARQAESNYRLPGLAMFACTTGGVSWVLPIVVFHTAAGSGAYAAPGLTLQEMRRIPGLHVAQLWQHQAPINVRSGGALVQQPITDLVLTGDFLMNYQRHPATAHHSVNEDIKSAYETVTLTKRVGAENASRLHGALVSEQPEGSAAPSRRCTRASPLVRLSARRATLRTGSNGDPPPWTEEVADLGAVRQQPGRARRLRRADVGRGGVRVKLRVGIR